MNKPILITGLPRTGTSLTAGLVHLSGIYFGPTVPGNRNNPKGFFENTGIRGSILKPYLSSLDCDPKGQSKLPPVSGNPPIPALKTRIERKLGLLRGERWAYKDPKILLAWEAFNLGLPGAKWIVTYRGIDSIIKSIKRTSFFKSKTDEEWRDHLEQYAQYRKEALNNIDCILEVFPHRLVGGDYEEIQKLESFLDIEIPKREALKFLDSNLWDRG